MVAGKLSVNLNKTEYHLFNPKHLNNSNSTINVDSNIISPNNSGVIFQSDICLRTSTSLLQLNHIFFNFVIFIIFVL